jgi:hypothetical protein
LARGDFIQRQPAVHWLAAMGALDGGGRRARFARTGKIEDFHP